MVSDPKVRLAEFAAVVGALADNAGRTFSSVRDAAEVLFEGPASAASQSPLSGSRSCV